MSNVVIRKENGNRPSALARPEARQEPVRHILELSGWDPFGEMAPFASQAPVGFMPSFEVKETKDGYSFKADLPGVKENDIDVTVTSNRLTIAGKRESEREEQADTYFACERTYGNFTRSFTLPDGVDMTSARAELKDGVLNISMKKAPGAETKKIAVQTLEKRS